MGTFEIKVVGIVSPIVMPTPIWGKRWVNFSDWPNIISTTGWSKSRPTFCSNLMEVIGFIGSTNPGTV